jgi:hypothetical protein
MLKKRIFIILILLFSNILTANSNATEKELISALQGGVKSTKEFLKKVPAYQLYEEDKSILHYAVALRNYDVIEFLISKNMELYRRGGIYYQTALQDAIFYQYFRIAILLINSGSPLDIKNIDGDTALHIAARNGYLDIVKVLIAKGASKNIYNNNNNTPYDTLPKFIIDNNKEAKAFLKPDRTLKIEEESKRQGTITTSYEIDRGQATFTLDQMYFDDQVGASIDNVIQRKNTQMHIIKDTEMKNSDIGINVYTH